MRRPRGHSRNILQQGGHALALLDDQVYVGHERGGILQRREKGGLGRHVDVVRRLDVDDVVHQPGAHDPVADAQPGEAGPLAQRSQHDKVFVSLHQLGDGLVAKLEVGLVDDYDQPRLQQLAYLLLRGQVAGRVVRRADEDQLRLGIDGVPHIADVYLEELVPLHEAYLAAGHSRAESIHPEGGFAVENCIAVGYEESKQQVYELIAAGAGDYVVRVHAGVVAQGPPHLPLERVGIDMQRRVGHRLDGLWGPSVRVLVAVELYDLVR